MELFNLPFAFGDILGTVIKVTGVKLSVSEDCLAERILNNGFLLTGIETGSQQ